MNQGLKSYTKQFTHNVSGVGTLSFNMCGAAKNMHMIIPLITTVGHSPISLSLIYNEQDKDVDGQFGKGFRLNLFKKLTQTSTGYEVLNADGSVDQYLASNNYYNKETALTLIPDESYGYFELKDKKGNYTSWYNGQVSYPDFYLDSENKGIRIGRIQDEIVNTNNDSNDIIYIQSSANTINLSYTNTSVMVLKKTVLTLTNNRITNIKYYEGASTLIGETEIIYETNAIKLKNVIFGTITKIDYTTQGTYKVYNGYLNNGTYDYPQLERFQISYISNKTTITDALGDSHTYYFDTNNLLYMEKNYKNETTYCCFDKENKKLTACNNFVLSDNYASSLSFDNIQNILLIGEEGKNDSSPVDITLWNKMKYLNYMGTQEKVIEMSVEPEDTLTFAFWLATYKNPYYDAVRITLSIDGQTGVPQTFFNKYNSKLELHSLTFKALKKSSFVKVKLEMLGASPIRIGGFQLSNKKFHSQFFYNENNLEKVVNGSDVLQYVYDDEGKNLLRTVLNGLAISINTYKRNGVLEKTTNEFGTVTSYGYNSVFSKLKETQQIINEDDSYLIEAKRVYSDDGRFLKETYGPLGEQTKFEYDNLNRLIKVTDALGKVTESAYSEGLLASLKRGATTTNQYEYDERKRLKKVKTGTLSTYEFVYNYKNQITEIRMDGIVILTYTYDSLGNINRLRYGTNGDYYDFVYDERNRVESIKYNGVSKFGFEYVDDLLVEIYSEGSILKEYIYDDQKRLVRVEDNFNSEYMEVNNIYNKDNMLTDKSVSIGNKTISQSFDDFKRSKDASITSAEDVKTIGFAGTNLTDDGNTVLDLFDVYPLHSSFNSLNGKKPHTFELNNTVDKPFKYNSAIKRYCFDSTKASVVYNFGNSTSGTIMARVLKTSINNEYLFGLVDTNGDKIDVYLEASGYMLLFVNGNRIGSTQMSFTTNTWHTVALSYGKGENASSTDTTHTRYFRLFLDGTVKTYSVSSNTEYTSMTSYIGYKEGSSYKFTGQIEMLCFRNAYCEESTLDQLMNTINIISTKSYVDEFQRINKKEVTKGLTNIISNEYVYDKEVLLSNVYGTYNVEMETIKAGSNTIATRTYIYDDLGRVTKVNDPVFGTKTYSYNDRGFLVNDNGTVITYDGNGNITKNGSDTFEYDATVKDKLIKYKGATVSYSSSNPLNIESTPYHCMEHEGKRMTYCESGAGYGYYEYNEQGLRTKKDWYGSPNITSSYYYDGDRLVTEIRDSNRFDFLYDEAGLLYGFILNNASKYFYVRDILQNILGIIDESGNLVVKYDYNAFGKILSVTDTSGLSIGSLNPFRYKGYYYDEETQLFYCNSRYYSPELCRWISPDSTEYLDPKSINGLNLYSYANNNPIGIAYSSSGAGFSTSGKMMSSLAISGNIIFGYGTSNKDFSWPNLDFLGTGFGHIENAFSMIAGVIDGVRKIKHLDKLAGLDKASKWLMRIGIGINVGLSLYNNLTNSNLSSAQKAGNIVGDIVYIAASSAATRGVAALTVMIPVVGPFIAPIVGFGFGTAFDQFWHGEDIIGIDGFSFNPGGKSIDEWIKDFFTELFGG